MIASLLACYVPSGIQDFVKMHLLMVIVSDAIITVFVCLFVDLGSPGGGLFLRVVVWE